MAVPPASLSPGVGMGFGRAVFNGLSWPGGLCHAVAVTGVTVNVVYWPNDGWRVTADRSRVSPADMQIWAGRVTGSVSGHSAFPMS